MQNNFITVVKLIAPLVFLPLVAFRYLVPAIPLYALYECVSHVVSPFITSLEGR